MIRHIIISILILGSAFPVSTQQCLTEGSFIPEYSQEVWDAMKRELNSSRNGEIDTLMITFFIMQNGRSGEKTVTLTSVYDILDATNDYFIETGIQFAICEDPLIINDPDFFLLNTEEAKILHKENKRNNTINVYIAERVTAIYNDGQELEICGSSAFPDEALDNKYILLNTDCLFRGKLLAHELGHFFGLMHTHDKSNGRELVDRTNCLTTGDLFCDTPADPQLSINTVDDCIYTGRTGDSEGTRYTPDVKNIMSYSPIGCQQYFSNDQLTHMAIIARNENAYLRRNCNLPDLSITDGAIRGAFIPGGDTKMEFRKQLQETLLDSFVTVHIYFSLRQEEVGTLIYDYDITDFSDLTSPLEEIEFTVPYGLPDGDGFIQILLDPLNTILESDQSNNRISIPTSIDRSAINNYSVFPNPTKGEIQYFFNDAEQFGDFLISVYDLKGQRLVSEKVEKAFPILHGGINIENYPAGVYYLQIVANQEIIFSSSIFKE